MRQRAAVAALALLLAGCGSTVQVSGRQSDTGDGLGNVTGGGGSSGTSTTGTTSSAGSNAPSGPSTSLTGTGGSTGSTSGSTGSTTGLTTAPTGSALRNGPGVTDTTITIGMTYNQNAAATNAALGASNISEPAAVASGRVLVDDINAHGGIAGHKLQVIYLAMDPNTNQTYATMGQQVCSYFTEDHKVLALIDAAPFADARACLEKHGVVHLSGALITDQDLYPHDLAVYSSALSRVFTAMVPALSAQGWFSGWDRLAGAPGKSAAKTGLVTVDDDYHHRVVERVLLPAMKALGHAPNPSDVIWITPPGGFSDDGSVAASIDNAVLKLNADGVDHVILDDTNGSLALLFTNYAYSQHYFPRYGGSTGNGWQTLLGAHDIQPKTLAGAIGLGWQPLVDLPYQSGDGPYSNAARHRCFDLFTKHGMGPTDQGTALGLAEGCDVTYLLPTALRGYRGPVNAEVVVQHVNALGTGYLLASGLGSRLTPDQHDGAGGFSYMHFDAGCSCVTYTGARRPMPH